MAEQTPQRAPMGEVAGTATGIGGLLAPYIGEVAMDPRQRSRYAHSRDDQRHVLLLYRDVLRDERVQAALDQRLDAATARPWSVEPGGPGRRDRRAADDLREQLSGIAFDRICRQMLYAVWYGFSVAEAMWEPRDGRVVLADLRPRAPDRFLWHPGGAIRLCSHAQPRGAEIPQAKFVVATRAGDHGDIPHAPGLARWCYWAVFLKRHGLRFWAVALDKFGAPTAIGKYRRGATDPERGALLTVLRDLAGGSAVSVPEDVEIQLIESMRAAGGDYAAFVAYLDRCITTTILGQSSTTDQGPWRGTAEIQRDVRDEAVIADARLLHAALNGTVARWLTDWNFPGASYPKITRDISPPDDLDARSRREERVARTSGLRPTRRHIERVYGGEWEELQPGGMNAAAADDRTGGGSAALAGSATAGEIIEEMLDADEWARMMDPVISPVFAAAKAARGFDDFRRRIDSSDGVHRSMNIEPVAGALHQGAFMAALSGAAGLGDDTPVDSDGSGA